MIGAMSLVQFTDNKPPICFQSAAARGTCSRASSKDCSQSEYWSTSLSVIDVSSTIVVADVDASGVTINVSLPLQRNAFSVVDVKARCCKESVAVRFVDDSGNVGSCTVSRKVTPKSCAVDCQNGGRCNSKTQKCQCIGGYIGNQCQEGTSKQKK